MDDCLFCKIANGEVKSEVVYKDEKVCAFNDINPRAPVHILIIPRKHIDGVNALAEDDKEVIGHILLVAKKLSEDKSVSESGFRILVNSGSDSGQIVEHLHFHLLGGSRLKPI